MKIINTKISGLKIIQSKNYYDPRGYFREVFKKNKIDLVSTSFNLEKEIVTKDEKINTLNSKLNNLVSSFGQIYIRKREITDEISKLDEILETGEDEFKSTNLDWASRAGIKKMASAPRILLSSTWYSSKINSRRSRGTFTWERVSDRPLSSPK